MSLPARRKILTTLQHAILAAAAAAVLAAAGCAAEHDLVHDGVVTVETSASPGMEITAVSVTARGGKATVRGWLRRERWRNWDPADRRVGVEVVDAGGQVLESARGHYSSLGRRWLGAAFTVPLKAVPPPNSVVRVVVE